MTLTGIGIHTGIPVNVTVEPAQAGSGIVFQTPNGPIAARAENVVDTTRCTVLAQGDARLSTVEHFLFACAARGVPDLTVTVDGPELPIGDGSAALWTELLASLAAPPVWRPIPRPLLVTGRGGAFIAVYPAETPSVTVAIHFEHPQVGTQVARFSAGDDLSLQVAPARTFGFWEEVEKLQAAGLARGGTLENALVIYPDRLSKPLRFADELARHKLLDLLGDLFLAGALPCADIIAVKPSHGLNNELARALA